MVAFVVDSEMVSNVSIVGDLILVVHVLHKGVTQLTLFLGIYQDAIVDAGHQDKSQCTIVSAQNLCTSVET